MEDPSRAFKREIDGAMDVLEFELLADTHMCDEHIAAVRLSFNRQDAGEVAAL